MSLVHYLRQAGTLGGHRPRLRFDAATALLLQALNAIEQASSTKFPGPNSIAERALVFYAKAWADAHGVDAKLFPILGEIDYLYNEYDDILDLSKPKKKD